MSLFRSGKVDRDALLIGLPGAEELDSMAVENDGNVCVGTLVDSGITVISPEGDVVEKLVTPKEVSDGAVTNICFGGPDMQTAYITLSLTGRVISCRWPRAGLRLPFQNVA
jgi:gluconolactonase